jgi:hypothetical protein
MSCADLEAKTVGYIEEMVSCLWRVPSITGCVDNMRDTSRQGKFLKILRIEIENYSHHHDNGNVLNRTSMVIDLFNTNLLDEI